MNRDLKLRLAYGAAVLDLIELRRAQTGDPDLGRAIEERIVDRELEHLESVTAVAECLDGDS